MVSRRVDESHRERVRGVENPRSVALGANNRRAVQGLRRYVLKIKQEANGYPKTCVTDEQKQHYIDEYYEREGIRLDPNKIEYNPGLRALAKFALNSLWGMYIMLVHTVNPR